MSAITVRQLIQGSRNIDRMRHEIEQVITMLARPARYMINSVLVSTNQKEIKEIIQLGDANSWYITGRVCGTGLTMGSVLTITHYLGQKVCLVFEGEGISVTPGLMAVQQVYNALQPLVDKLLQLFPDLQTQVASLKNAADESLN